MDDGEPASRMPRQVSVEVGAVGIQAATTLEHVLEIALEEIRDLRSDRYLYFGLL